MTRSLLLAITLVAAAPSAASAQQQHGREGNTWRWDGRVENGRWFHVFNVNGSVTVTPSPDNMVHVVAEKRSNGRATDVVHYEVVQQDGNVTICAIWNNNARCEDGGYESMQRRGGQENAITVSFAIRVPKGIRVGAHSVNGGVSVREVGVEVRAQTVNGGIEVKNAGGRVRAKTVNGKLDVNTLVGPVSASTVNGDVEARMSSLQGTENMDFKTVNGSIKIVVPARFDGDVRFDTVHGAIDSDFPMAISGRYGPRTARGRIGNGSRHLRASAVNGSIELRKL